jgi:hypothetical protein
MTWLVWPLLACCPLWDVCPPLCDMSRGDGLCLSILSTVLLLQYRSALFLRVRGAGMVELDAGAQQELPLAGERKEWERGFRAEED